MLRSAAQRLAIARHLKPVTLQVPDSTIFATLTRPYNHVREKSLYHGASDRPWGGCSRFEQKCLTKNPSKLVNGRRPTIATTFIGRALSLRRNPHPSVRGDDDNLDRKHGIRQRRPFRQTGSCLHDRRYELRRALMAEDALPGSLLDSAH
jgi:hypothetical protein